MTASTTALGNGTHTTIAEDEIDLTVEPVRWVAPGTEVAVRAPEPEPEPATEEHVDVSLHRHHAWGLILGAGAVLLLILLSSLLGILFNRVDDLEHKVERLESVEQPQP